MITEDPVITEDHVTHVQEVLLLAVNLRMLFLIILIVSAQNKRGLFDQKPEGIPEEFLNSEGAIGAMTRALNSNAQESKSIRRLIITNLPTDYQESVYFSLFY